MISPFFILFSYGLSDIVRLRQQKPRADAPGFLYAEGYHDASRAETACGVFLCLTKGIDGEKKESGRGD